MAVAFDPGAVAALSKIPIPSSAKGFGGLPAGTTTTAETLAARGARLFDGTFTFPQLTVRESAVAHNVGQMAAFCASVGVDLAPHAKTTMAPQLFARQLAAGAWGLTVATTAQAQVCREFGVRRLLLANELVDPAGIAWVAAELAADAGFDLYCYVDSIDGVRLLDRALASYAPGSTDSRRLPVLVELGREGGRTGCRRTEDAVVVAAAAAATGTLSVAGVAGYEGGIAHDRSFEALAAVDAYCQRLVDLADRLVASALVAGRPIVTAGGSAFPDVVAAALGRASDRATVLLRSGCYITHDDGEYARVSPFTGSSPYALTAAIELWAQVLSRPEPGLVLLGAGRRDVGFDQGFPVPRSYRAADGAVRPFAAPGAGGPAVQVFELNDQHAYLSVPVGSSLAVGDHVCLGISHPCTTLDRWRHVLQVADDDTGVAQLGPSVTDVVLTYF